MNTKTQSGEPTRMAHPVSTSPGPASAIPGAKSALALLIGINLFNYIDRQILSAVLPLLQLDGTIFDPTDPWLKFKLGTLTSAFLVAYMIFSPLVGWLDGHGYRRWVILGVGVSVWSIASGCSGFATGYWMLLATRCLVGVGEGAYGPVASAMIADAYPLASRAKALAFFNMAIPVGSAIGFVVGGQVADYYDDWRHAFWLTFLGLGLGTYCFLKKELPRPQTAAQAENAPGYFAVLKRLTRNSSFVYCCVGMTAITFVLGGVAAWIPTYVFQRESRFVLDTQAIDSLTNPPEETKAKPLPDEVIAKLRAIATSDEIEFGALKGKVEGALTNNEMVLHFEPVARAATTLRSPKLGSITTIFGGIVVLGGFAATGFATWLGERLRPRLRGAYFWVIGGGALAALPCFIAFVYLPLPWGWLAMFFAVVGLFMHVGPGFTILANVVTSEMRATAFAINILVIHVLGDVISPPLIGAAADAFHWNTALIGTSAMILVGAFFWFLGAEHLEGDTLRASASE